MFGRQAKSEIDSLVGISARIEGDLKFSGGLRIEGEVHCASLVVNGFIAGAVYSSELLELQPKGRIHGDVHYRLLEMHGGALVTGKLTHEPQPAYDEPVFHLTDIVEGSAA